ncbi:CotH kinase family protein [Pseudobacteroides cellulosolvens]|uniref:Spore coat protein CotH n=1 Tax=Pseudobacteroides cellulosolvens ATCC 35603 = DSM 2933 TaxID=398512 RepID=A0A0L6JKV2_9FIRM|nr:CotH kinase family protein [Pseudobacteroides cellulosolvens]KNY26012.1 Spore coat protein CotH [Pseudobacteroides cellulosolvens ATCC 35603 = DSM 2933]
MKRGLSLSLTASLILTAVTSGVGLDTTADSAQALFINEVMASNATVIRDGDVEDTKDGAKGGAYSDWIEIYNNSSESIDLTGYTISDDAASWTFPKGVVPAKGYLLVWASDKDKVAMDGQLHTNFKISSSGETITLKMPDGTVVDMVKTLSTADDQSYQRKIDGVSEMVISAKSTPKSANVFVEPIAVIGEPVFSYKGGFYNDAINLELTTTETNAKIYYTKNGSDPVPGAAGTFEYTGSINVKSRAGEANVLSMIQNISGDKNAPWIAPTGEVFKCTTIKAVVVKSDGKKSKIITHSYFVDPNMKTRYNLPVISLVTDEANLFDNNTGIYVNGNFLNEGQEWERPMHMEFFEKDGTLGFSHDSGVRLHGGWSRKYPQKTFRMYAEGYGDTDSFKYDIFPGLTKEANGKKLNSFKTLLIRNAGNDWASTMMRDEVMHKIVSHLDVETMAYRPSVVFLNGEYWGIYNIRERYDKHYLASHFNLEKDNVAILDYVANTTEKIDVQEGTQADADAFMNDITNYLKSNSITQNATYEQIKTKMDVSNFIDYNISEIFFGNTDWPGNNVSMWKYKTDDGKYHPEAPIGQDGRWRWFVKDMDFGLGLYNSSVNHNTLNYATLEYAEGGRSNYPWAVFLLKTLLQNTEFRNEFINRFADHINTTFDPVRINTIVDEAKSAIEAAMPEHSKRWNKIKMTATRPTDATWSKDIEVIKSYASNRPAIVRQHIVSKFGTNGVTGTASIKLNSVAQQGFIRINSLDVKSDTPGVTNAEAWTGTYFKGVPVTIKAVPQAGYKFDHWEGAAGVDASSDTITVTPSANLNLTAVFKVDDVVTPTPTSYKVSGYVGTDIESNVNLNLGFLVEIPGGNISATTDANGYFELANVPKNTALSIRISKKGFLLREIKNIDLSKDIQIATNEVPLIMWAGDIPVNGVGDNSINMSDVIQIAKSFNAITGDVNYNIDADINKDNAVNIKDVIILAKHFNASGY